ncbi:LysM peptidoglycan-binding domain-containing protein [Haloferula rosea]|uniref:LysM peptidoglycan-binding domain-containing protein n=1 Tax=Haloferula rosea TaxID=490093 RepID=UPI001F2017E5|nr:LysM domain-containing protein [Haloferula rosea]
MKWIPLCWIALTAVALAGPESVSELRRQVEEQERQIKQLEVENSRLRYMLTEARYDSVDPLYGTKVSGRPAGEVVAESPSQRHHVVAAGETLSKIAKERRADFRQLAELNGLSEPFIILPGQRLKLPDEVMKDEEAPAVMVEATPKSNQSHTVSGGENLYRISLRYGVSLDELMAANPSIDPRKLRIGQKVEVPRSGPMLAGGR